MFALNKYGLPSVGFSLHKKVYKIAENLGNSADLKNEALNL